MGALIDSYTSRQVLLGNWIIKGTFCTGHHLIKEVAANLWQFTRRIIMESFLAVGRIVGKLTTQYVTDQYFGHVLLRSDRLWLIFNDQLLLGKHLMTIYFFSTR